MKMALLQLFVFVNRGNVKYQRQELMQSETEILGTGETAEVAIIAVRVTAMTAMTVTTEMIVTNVMIVDAHQ